VNTPGPAPERERPAQDEDVAQEQPAPADGAEPPRRWVWMDRWDPGTWEMPENPTRTQRIMAGICLIIIFIMIFYVPFKMLGVF
jgi:hypothetical protein